MIFFYWCLGYKGSKLQLPKKKGDQDYSHLEKTGIFAVNKLLACVEEINMNEYWFFLSNGWVSPLFVWRAGLPLLDLDVIDALGFLHAAMRNQMTSFRYCSDTCKMILGFEHQNMYSCRGLMKFQSWATFRCDAHVWLSCFIFSISVGHILPLPNILACLSNLQSIRRKFKKVLPECHCMFGEGRQNCVRMVL